MISGFSRSDIVHEGYDIAYVLLWEVLISGTVDDTAQRRGFNAKDVERIHKQVEKITLRLKSRARDFLRRDYTADEIEHARELQATGSTEITDLVRQALEESESPGGYDGIDEINTRRRAFEQGIESEDEYGI